MHNNNYAPSDYRSLMFLTFHSGDPLPRVEYTEEEIQTWYTYICRQSIIFTITKF